MPSTPHLRTLRGPYPAFARFIDLPPAIRHEDCCLVIQHVVNKHDVLRLKMERLGARRVFTIQPEGTPPEVNYIDVSEEYRIHGEAAIRICADTVKEEFSVGNLFARFAYFSIPERGMNCLAAILDHIVYDTYAIEVLEEDVTRAFAQFHQGLPIDLGPRSVSYRGFWSRLNKFQESAAAAADRDYWTNLQWPDVCTLPVDEPRGYHSFSWIWEEERGAIVPYWDGRFRTSASLSLDEDTSRALLRLSAHKHGTITEQVICGLLGAMQQYSGVSDRPFSITLIINKRIGVLDDVDTSQTMGNFAGRCHVVFDCRNISDQSTMLNLVRARLAELPTQGKTQDILIDFDARVSGYVLSGIAVNYLGRNAAHAFGVDNGGSFGSTYTLESGDSLPGMVRWPEYVLSGMKPGQDYLARLHFVEPVFDAVDQRFFDVWLNGALAVEKLDIIREAGAKLKAVAVDIPCAADENGRISLNLVSYHTSAGKAIISAIEILEPPATHAFEIPYDYALFTPILQVNAGGAAVGDFLADEHQIGGEPVTLSDAIDISGVRSAAPLYVYASACCCPTVYYRPHFPSITFQCGIVDDVLHFNILFATNLYRHDSIERLGGLLLDNLRRLAEAEG